METLKRSDVNVRSGTLDCIFLLESTTNNDDFFSTGAPVRSFSDKKRARSALLSSRATKLDQDLGSGTKPSSIILRMSAWPRERFFLVALPVSVKCHVYSIKVLSRGKNSFQKFIPQIVECVAIFRPS